jgi:hypothetical protein
MIARRARQGTSPRGPGRPGIWLVWLVACLWLAPGRDAHAQAAPAALMQARAALDEGAYQRAADLVAPLVGASPGSRPGGESGPALDRSDQAEAWRIHGLALFFLGRYGAAEVSFFEYLKLDVDGRLDPALVPPEAIVFFEDVRARNAAELRKYRPAPRRKRSWALNLLPPAGQFQNRDHTKGWLIAGTGTVLLATNVSSFLILRDWCNPVTGTCTSDGEPRTEQARALRTVNLISGALFFGLLTYGVVDGFVHYRHDDSLSIGLSPGQDGVSVFLHGRY